MGLIEDMGNEIKMNLIKSYYFKNNIEKFLFFKYQILTVFIFLIILPSFMIYSTYELYGSLNSDQLIKILVFFIFVFCFFIIFLFIISKIKEKIYFYDENILYPFPTKYGPYGSINYSKINFFEIKNNCLLLSHTFFNINLKTKIKNFTLEELGEIKNILLDKCVFEK